MSNLISYIDRINEDLGYLASAVQEVDKDLAERIWVASGLLIEVMDKLELNTKLESDDKIKKWKELQDFWREAAIKWFEQEEDIK